MHESQESPFSHSLPSFVIKDEEFVLYATMGEIVKESAKESVNKMKDQNSDAPILKQHCDIL